MRSNFDPVDQNKEWTETNMSKQEISI